jgi:hypothetical protein
VARAPGLKFALLAALVVVAHLLGLEWFGRQADAISGLSRFAPPMYTRLLEPATPPPVVTAASTAPAQPRPRVAPLPRPPASSPEELQRANEQRRAALRAEALRRAEERRRAQEQRVAEEQRLAEEARRAAAAAAQPEAVPQPPGQAVAQAPEAAASAPSVPASAPQQVASAAAQPASAAASAAGAVDPWPADTRLSYRLDGQWRSGPLFGDARVQWQRDGGRYQVRLDVKIQVFGTQVLTSQGEVTPNGLVPRLYEELRPGKRRAAQLGDQVVTLDNGTTVKRPPGVQDTASQFVELSQRFATGKDVLAVGRSVTVWLARPGAVDQWTYDVVGRDMLRTGMGEVEAFHLQPRPIANPRGNITAEMWFAPSLQYLPVRIKVIMGTEAFLDLTVDRIEQR